MAQVSKRRLNKSVEKRMYEVFWKSLADLKKPKDVQRFLFDLLTPTERTMLAKRLSIAVLLKKGYGYEAISDILKVSYTTIWNISLWLKNFGEGFNFVIEKIIRHEEFKGFLLDLEEALGRFLAAHPASKARTSSHYQHRRFKEREKVI